MPLTRSGITLSTLQVMKSKRYFLKTAKGQGTSQFPDEYLDRTLGLMRLQALTRNFPWANA